MSQCSTNHTTFVIEQSYDVPPAVVFKAFADRDAKAKWFTSPPDWEREPGEFDFRVGGREVSGGGPKEGPKHRYEARFQDIVPNERIVSSYDMHLDELRISVSLVTIALKQEGAGTKLVYTEQAVFLDGHDNAEQREGGTRWLFDMLRQSLPKT